MGHDELNLVSFNCRGLGGRQKRRDVLNMLRSSPHDVFCLQDIHILKNDISAFLTLWRGMGFFSCFTRSSRGVCILFRPSFQFTLLSEERDENGNFIAIGFEYQGSTYTVFNVYGPNEDEPDFYENINGCIGKIDTDHIILCGDFNLVIDQNKDTLNYAEEHNKKAKQVLISTYLRKTGTY